MQHRIGTQIIAVFIGGLIGGAMRELLMLVIHLDNFPLNTLVVNLTGVFLTVLVTTHLCRHWHQLAYVHELIDVGVLGAYTTYGTIIVDISTHQSLVTNGLYLLLTVVGSVGMVYLARLVGRRRYAC